MTARALDGVGASPRQALIRARKKRYARPQALAASGAAGLAAVLWASSLIAPVAMAAEYSWQVSGRYEDVDSEAGVETSHSSLRATYYLSAVDDRVGPYELAPFLNRSSYVSVGTGRTKLREQLFPALFSFQSPDGVIDMGPIGTFGSPLTGQPTQFGLDSSEYAVDGRYVWPGAGWYAGARAARNDADGTPAFPFAQTKANHESAGVFAGRYFGSRTALELGFGSDTASQEERIRPFGFDPTSGLPGLPGFPDIAAIELRAGTDTETDDARLSVRHVGELGDSTFALSASIRSRTSETRLIFPFQPDLIAATGPFDPPDGGFVAVDPYSMPGALFESERERQFSLSGALFPTQAVGIRVTYTESDHDTFGLSDRVGLSTNWFFVRNASAEIELIRTSSARRFSGTPDTNSLGVRLLGRF